MTTAASYDDLPYGSRVIRETHPDHLAAVAILFSRTPPPVDGARVLELGCAEGGNILPMAGGLPGARFVGVDYSERQVALAEERRRALGLTNVELLRMDVAQAGEGLGSFDYVLAHGLFSWVPVPLQETILALLGALLTPDGLAYVSFNTFPGWHQRGMVREILLRATRDAKDPAERIARARGFLEFLAASARDRSAAYGAALAEELEQFGAFEDAKLFHEYLEAENHPLYYADFVAHAREHGLVPVGDARLASMPMGGLRPELHAQLAAHATDADGREQLLDFLRNRRFRQAILGRAGSPVPEEPDPGALDSLLFSSRAKAASPAPDLAPGVYEEFVAPHGRLSAADPVLKRALLSLQRAAPRPLLLSELGATSGERDALRQPMLTCLASGFVDPHAAPARCAGTAGDRPEAWSVARLHPPADPLVPSLLHRNVQLDPFGRLLVGAADGTRDREALAVDVAEKVAAAGLLSDGDGKPVSDLEAIRSFVRGGLESALANLARMGLLVG